MIHSAVLFSIFITITTQAYVPPSFHIARSIAHKHQGLEEGRFRSKVSFFKSSGEVSRTVTETLYFSSPDTVTIRLTDEVGKEVATASRRLANYRVGDTSRSITWDLLFIRDGAIVYENLRARGIPMTPETELYSEKEGNMPYKPETTVKLARKDGKVAVVVSESGSRSPQLWVEKDSLLPLRAIFPSDSIEYQMSGFQLYKSFLYPRTIQVLRDGKLWARVDTQEVRLGQGNGALEPLRGKSDADGQTVDFAESYLKWVR